MSQPGTAKNGPPATPGRDSHSGQRFGNVADPHVPAGGPNDSGGDRLVRDEDTGVTYSFGSEDIVTEGLRTVRTGERVRFLIDPAAPRRGRYVIRLDLPDIDEFYQ
jgi:hypothetical protein